MTSEKGNCPGLRRSPDPCRTGQIICDGIGAHGKQTDILLINPPPLSHQSTVAFHLYLRSHIFFNTPPNRLTTFNTSDQFSQERNKIEASPQEEEKKPSFLAHRGYSSTTSHTWPPPPPPVRSPHSPLHRLNRANSAKSTLPPTHPHPLQKTSHLPKSAKHGPTSSPAAQVA